MSKERMQGEHELDPKINNKKQRHLAELKILQALRIIRQYVEDEEPQLNFDRSEFSDAVKSEFLGILNDRFYYVGGAGEPCSCCNGSGRRQ